MLWFFRNPERLKLEIASVDSLSKSSNWLVGTNWLFDGGLLCLDAVIRVRNHDYEVRVSFPALYPDAPTFVCPKNNERFSSHQYIGSGGALCLEWGPDNWRHDITVDVMLESTWRLLEIEKTPEQSGLPVVAPSRHELSVGQSLRGAIARIYVGEPLIECLRTQPTVSTGSFKFSLRKTGETWTTFIHELTSLPGATWKDLQVPSNLSDAEQNDLMEGLWIKTDLNSERIGDPKNFAELQHLFSDTEIAHSLLSDGNGFVNRAKAVLICDGHGKLHPLLVLAAEKLLPWSVVYSAPTKTIRTSERNVLNTRTVGIVGLGSVGSKIALSLARMGVSKLFLVDHDILLPENLQRHALDWDGVAQHKVDAARAAINRLVPEITVEISRLHLTGQESNASVSGALNRLASCDMIVDATANPKVFNCLGGVARQAGKPMVWVEVFGGGIGGLVARSRPGLDPIPLEMRNALLQYCEENPAVNPLFSSEPYVSQNGEDEPMVASDADVTIIAQHAVRFVADSFILDAKSKFPYSMYLVGLSEGWVFEAPFVTIPISMASYSSSGWVTDANPTLDIEIGTFLVNLITAPANATNSSS